MFLAQDRHNLNADRWRKIDELYNTIHSRPN